MMIVSLMRRRAHRTMVRPANPMTRDTAQRTHQPTPNEALAMLVEGNRRYVEDRPRHPHQRRTHRHHTAAGQHPFAAILGCGDSRVPPEIVFDEGLGDLFVIRSAGHIVDDALIGSLEFAVGEFGIPLVLVLGHERCGAVKAAVEEVLDGGAAPGHIESVLAAIRPAVELAQSQGASDVVDATVRANVELVVGQLRSDEPILAERVQSSRLRIVGAYYNLEDGAVSVIVP
jgi:carbonic anhydrase